MPKDDRSEDTMKPLTPLNTDGLKLKKSNIGSLKGKLSASLLDPPNFMPIQGKRGNHFRHKNKSVAIPSVDKFQS